MSEKEHALIGDFIRLFDETFKSRPLMLGEPIEVNAMFYVIDQIEFIHKYGERMDFGKYSWNAFLIEKKYIKEAHNLLHRELQENTENFDLLQKLRREYKGWLSSKMK